MQGGGASRDAQTPLPPSPGPGCTPYAHALIRPVSVTPLTRSPSQLERPLPGSAPAWPGRTPAASQRPSLASSPSAHTDPSRRIPAVLHSNINLSQKKTQGERSAKKSLKGGQGMTLLILAFVVDGAMLELRGSDSAIYYGGRKVRPPPQPHPLSTNPRVLVTGTGGKADRNVHQQ